MISRWAVIVISGIGERRDCDKIDELARMTAEADDRRVRDGGMLL
jgi:hypothetical protein